MSWLGKLFGGGRKDGFSSLPTQGDLPTLGAVPSASSFMISQGTAMAVSTVYACVMGRAQDVARCTPRLYRKDAGGKKVEVTEHPVAKFFRRPNEYQTWFEFMEQMQAGKDLRGNAYAVKRLDGRGRLRDCIPVNPDAVLVLESYEGRIFYNVNRIGLWQIAMLRDFPSSISADDMMHLRGLSFNALVALSPIGMARDAIGLAMGLEQQGARWVANGARPSMVLQSSKSLSETTAQRLKRQFDSLTSGVANTGKTIVLEDGIEAKPMTLTSADMALIEQRKLQTEDIARFYRYPLHKLGAADFKGVNMVQMDQDYVSNTIMPELERWEQKFEQAFGLVEEGLEVNMDDKALLRADVTSRYNAARIGLLSGFLKPDEVRADEGLDPVPGGDQVYRPLNMAALGSDATGTAPDGAGKPGRGELPADATDGAEPRGGDGKGITLQ